MLIRDPKRPARFNDDPTYKPRHFRTWYNISNLAFDLEKLEGFLYEPGHLEGGVPVPAVTTVFFNGHSAVVSDPKGELHRFLLEKREFIEPEPAPLKQVPPPLPPQG